MRYLSLFSGIEAASVAWEPLGWTPVAFAEIESFPCALLAHRFPHVPNLGDVTKITDEQIAALGPVDVVIGGSPCQDLSVAGGRAGLAGARSSLFHEQVRIFHAARTLCGARWLLWENVPGAFSTHGGRDFAVVVGALAGCELAVPADGWGYEGVALGERGLVEWAVLDAQWFGVAQRRRRVFAVLDAGNWRDRPPVLLEPESLRGDPPTRGKAGQGTPARALRSSDDGIDREDGHTLIAHALRADGFDASEDGTGRGTPLVPEVAATLSEVGGHARPGDNVQSADSLIPEVALCLNAVGMGRQDGESETMVPVAFAQNQRDEVRSMHEVEGKANAGGQVAVAFHNNVGEYAAFDEHVPALKAAMQKDPPSVLRSMQVRRLTPTECERLQGFPDGWTQIPYRNKPAADGPRYRALGNSMAVPVIAWIGRQIERAHEWRERAVA